MSGLIGQTALSAPGSDHKASSLQLCSLLRAAATRIAGDCAPLGEAPYIVVGTPDTGALLDANFQCHMCTGSDFC